MASVLRGDPHQPGRRQERDAVAPAQHLAAIEPVGDLAGRQHQEELRQELGEPDQAEMQRAVGQLVDVPADHDPTIWKAVVEATRVMNSSRNERTRKSGVAGSIGWSRDGARVWFHGRLASARWHPPATLRPAPAGSRPCAAIVSFRTVAGACQLDAERPDAQMIAATDSPPLATVAVAAASSAAAAADFYRGKTLRLMVGSDTGGGYDSYARTFAHYLRKHIPGEPTIVVQNMPGAGGMAATNWLFNVAPKDGTCFRPAAARHPVPSVSSARRTRSSCRPSSTGSAASMRRPAHHDWHTAKVKTLADALKETAVLGGSGPNDSETHPDLMNNTIGTKFRIVSGYKSNSTACWRWSAARSKACRARGHR